MLSLLLPLGIRFKAACRFASILAYGFSLLIVRHVQPIAAKAYDDLCASQGVTFGIGESDRHLMIAMFVIAVPVLLARSKATVGVNLIVALMTVIGAAGLLSTAADTPYECFTQAGTYEDHTSGLDGFSLWFGFIAFISYVVLMVDLTVWVIGQRRRPWRQEPLR
jgi:hypothetical protein